VPRLGTADRRQRVRTRKTGSGASSSQDILILVARLFELSKRSAAKSGNGNWSTYTYAGLPMLLSALQALVVEYEHLLNLHDAQEPLDINTPEFAPRYKISGQLLEDLNDLIELRNEIIHPAHVPTGTADNWPDYLRRVKNLGLLNTSEHSVGDYPLLGQMASHRLFELSLAVVRSLYEAVIMSDGRRTPSFLGFLETFESEWFKDLPPGVLW
jgi:hypothetical protein